MFPETVLYPAPPAEQPRGAVRSPLPVSFRLLAVGWLLVFGAIVVATDLSNSFSSDDGAYALGVHAQADGDRSLDRPLAVVGGAYETIVNGIYTADGPVPYVRHPAYLGLLRTTNDLFGVPWGLHVPALLSLLFFPFAIRSAARELDPSIGDIAFLLAIVSPVLVNGLAIWAHAPSALLGALSLRYAIRLFSDVTAGRSSLLDATGLSVMLALGILARAEALLWALALLAAIVLIGRTVRLLAWSTMVAIPVGAVFLFERVVKADLDADAIAITFPDAPSRPSWLAGRPGAAWHELGSAASQPSLAGLLTLVALVLAVYGAFVWRRGDRDPAPMLWIAATLYALRLVLVETELATGLVAAWPVALVLLVAGGSRLERTEQMLAVAGALFLVAVLATQHAGASGIGWGGRYLTLLIPVMALMSARAVVKIERAERQWGSGPYLALAALAILPVASGLRATSTSRDIHASSISFMTQDEPEVVVTEFVAFGRLGWHATIVDGVDWYRADDGNLADLLADLQRAEVARISVQGFVDTPIVLDGYQLTTPDEQLRTLDRIG